MLEQAVYLMSIRDVITDNCATSITQFKVQVKKQEYLAKLINFGPFCDRLFRLS